MAQPKNCPFGVNTKIEFNMYSEQLAVKTQPIYCTVCTMYKTTCFGLFWPSSGSSYSLEIEVSYGQIYHLYDISAHRTPHSPGYTKNLKMAKIGRNM